jgi:hypothetical protein
MDLMVRAILACGASLEDIGQAIMTEVAVQRRLVVACGVSVGPETAAV